MVLYSKARLNNLCPKILFIGNRVKKMKKCKKMVCYPLVSIFVLLIFVLIIFQSNGITLTLWGASIENDFEYLKTIRFSIFEGFVKNDHVNGKCVVVIRKNKGRLGNKMFMYSTAYSFARQRGCCLYYHSEDFNELSQIFLLNSSKICFISKEEFSKLINVRRVNNGGCTVYSDLVTNVLNQSIELTGYWQSYRYFLDYEEEIRQLFQFNEKIQSRSITYIKNENLSNRTVVGIHIRRGDFLSFRHGTIGGLSASSNEYISNGMNYFIQKYSNPIFIVVSDDKSWCKEFFQRRNDVLITPEDFSPADDLSVLRLSDHNLITTGTYSWWIGYFTNGEVIYDHNYPKKGSLLWWNCHKKDYFPPKFQSLK